MKLKKASDLLDSLIANQNKLADDRLNFMVSLMYVWEDLDLENSYEDDLDYIIHNSTELLKEININ